MELRTPIKEGQYLKGVVDQDGIRVNDTIYFDDRLTLPPEGTKVRVLKLFGETRIKIVEEVGQ